MPKILIVDDDITITELIKTVVRLEGFEPTVVNDSTRAMEAAHSVNPDVITLDIMMPKLSGLELCALLRQDPKFANTPILIISAKVDAASRQKALQAGAKEFITKPFRIDDLLTTIKNSLT
jgi:DNA-binding response OmpR family regulator